MPAYIAICIGGLATFAASLLQREFSSDDLQVLRVFDEVNDQTQGHAGCGKIEVSTTVDPATLWLKSRFIMNWLVKLTIIDSLSSVSDFHSALTSLGSSSISSAVTVLRLHASTSWPEPIRPMVTSSHQSPSSGPTLYRASCVRSGNSHPFTSLDVSRTLGSTLGEIFPEWKASMKEYEIRVIAYVLNSSAWIGMSLNNRDYQRNKGNLDSEFRYPHGINVKTETTSKIGLRPSTCALLIELADLKSGEIVCDPTSGMGSICIEGRYKFGDEVAFLGGDIDKEINELRMVAAVECGLTLWDCTRLPLRDGLIDVWICDPPFGVHCGKTKDAITLLKHLLRECRRCSAEGGRMIMLIAHRIKELRRLTFPNEHVHAARWRIVKERKINLGGMLAYIVEMAAV
ncbi:hypothetical protein TrVE_jg9289 [Triparma verrucosa]|uniref:Uncharacterized protein n=1 Tax=Triparma verrucosa TaxID=1606542 RepID=A0A9W7BHW5_9STRA|nr:hypothetical protein TrVE_jg9289 [Triparma verrucosa]